MADRIGRGMWWQAEGQAWGRLKIEGEDEDAWEHQADLVSLRTLWSGRFWSRSR